MEDSDTTGISWFDQVKIQTEALLPVLSALRNEIGEQEANRIVYGALRKWMKQMYEDMSNGIEGTPLEKWQKINEEIESTYIHDLEIRPIKNDSKTWEFDVTGCRFADYFRQLGEPELGAILNCEADNHLADVGESEVEFNRTQTIMKGGKCCDFRFKFVPKKDN